jgi:hypothetical protein
MEEIYVDGIFLSVLRKTAIPWGYMSTPGAIWERLNTYRQRLPTRSGESWCWRWGNTRGRCFQRKLDSLASLGLREEIGGQYTNQKQTGSSGAGRLRRVVAMGMEREERMGTRRDTDLWHLDLGLTMTGVVRQCDACDGRTTGFVSIRT